jgi:hypothetical protein
LFCVCVVSRRSVRPQRSLLLLLLLLLRVLCRSAILFVSLHLGGVIGGGMLSLAHIATLLRRRG